MLLHIVITVFVEQIFRLKCLTTGSLWRARADYRGLVKAGNIRHTHFSRNPKIAEFLRDYNFVKEYGEGVDRMCRELEAAGLQSLSTE